MKDSFKIKLKSEILEFKTLLHSVPMLISVIFIITVFAMNLLANKNINIGVDWLAIDCGMLISWFAFLAMDVLTKYFGAKASTQISLLASIINLAFCLIFFLISLIPGVWSESYVIGSENAINTALNNTIGGTWFVVIGSMCAFITSAIVYSLTNVGISKLIKRNKDSFRAYIVCSYISTAIGQFVDNLVFSLIVSLAFFDWSILQCVTCALTGMLIELAFSMLFSPLGYRIVKKWKENGVGEKYFTLINAKTSPPTEQNTHTN